MTKAHKATPSCTSVFGPGDSPATHGQVGGWVVGTCTSATRLAMKTKVHVVASINKHSARFRSKYKAFRSKTQMQNEYKNGLGSTKSTLEANTSTKSRCCCPYRSILSLCEHPEHCGYCSAAALNSFLLFDFF